MFSTLAVFGMILNEQRIGLSWRDKSPSLLGNQFNIVQGLVSSSLGSVSDYSTSPNGNLGHPIHDIFKRTVYSFHLNSV